MNDYPVCEDTPIGHRCLVCHYMGAWERPEVTFDDWYPKPCPPEPPLRDEMSWLAFAVLLIVFCVICFGLGNLITTGHYF